MDPGTPAGFVRRLGAKLVDAIAIGWLGFCLGILMVHLAIGPDAFDPSTNSSTTTGLGSAFLGACAMPFLFIAYNVAFIGICGATPGRLLFGVRVTSVDGGPVHVGRAMQRTLAEFPSLLLGGIGYWLAGAQRQTWHDRWSKTIAIRAPGRVFPRFGGAPAEGVAIAAVCTVVAVGIGIVALGPALAQWAESFQPAEDRYIRAGIRANAEGKSEVALQVLTKALEANPQSALAYANRGAIHGDMGNFDLQIADCERALSIDSTQVFALLGLANARRNLRQYPEALTDYSAAIRVRPEWSGLVFAYRGRGSVLYRLGRFEEAAADFAEGARIAQANYLGTSDFAKGADFLFAIAMCEEFHFEALRRLGRTPEAPKRDVAEKGGMNDPGLRNAALRDWLGVGEGIARADSSTASVDGTPRVPQPVSTHADR